MDDRALPRTEEEWAELLRALPGYDPFRDAGDCTFDEDAAAIIVEFFERHLRHVKGKWAGTPILLERWQKAILCNLFGWKRPDGTRRYRRCFLYLPRKNSKSTLCAGIALYMLRYDGEQGGECYSFAGDAEQASLIYDIATGMVRQSPMLARSLRVFRGFGHRSIVHEPSASRYRVMPSDAEGTHGLNPHLAVIDELHVVEKADMIQGIMTGMGARSQPILLMATTADYMRESPCNTELEYARRVRDGLAEDGEYLPCIWEASADDDPFDEAVWERVNPNLDVSVSRDFLRAEFRRAKEEPSRLNSCMRLYLNVQTQSVEQWAIMSEWDNQPHTAPDLTGLPCVGGLDMSSTQDLTSFALVWRLGDDEYAVRWWNWVPAENMEERERKDRTARYSQWHREGFIFASEGDYIDYAAIGAKLTEIIRSHRVKQIAFDARFATETAQKLEALGVEMVRHPQGYTGFTESCHVFERSMRAGKFRHLGNPVARWAALNCYLKRHRENEDLCYPVKGESTGRIDPIMAMLMALSLAKETAAKPMPGVSFI